ncbi:DHBP synthase RibB-like alpha/beta domain-containing protein [Apiospora kogelbergensis]|uniref:Threonylcarbamoyl-AMP synthase n=1 Tax=Apiospora kogelbergensis TaxID=1337665 RepID=A0AAW0QVY0_9PEZI
MSQVVPSRTGTRILKVGNDELGKFRQGGSAHQERLGTWEVSATDSSSVRVLREAAEYLRTKDIPVGFPTETVYGLGADATRSAAVKGIYTAKGRPSDNPLIVHVSDLDMLRVLLTPHHSANGTTNGHSDPIPEIYKPLISRFWPGPLTILLPNPEHSLLAPEVTAGLQTFGARMPSSPLALTLIKLAGAPLAAPSANASTRPSATTASDVLEDMKGRIDLVLDGGPCQVGVESTVVDGLCSPPVVLRPGGVSMAEIRSCPGWDKVEKAYKDQSELGKAAPRAPGMKYKHYSPKARVVLYEATYAAGKNGISEDDVDYITQTSQQAKEAGSAPTTIGIIRTRSWKTAAGLRTGQLESREVVEAPEPDTEVEAQEAQLLGPKLDEPLGKLLDLSIGVDARSAAKGLFSALRELDRRKADVIFVEGIPDNDDIAAAVMNRLRKAASEIRS